MSKTYDLSTISGVLRQIAKTKGVNWAEKTEKKGGALSSYANPTVRKLQYAAGILGVSMSDIFLSLENPEHIDTLPGPPQPEVIQEDGGTPITGEQGGEPVTGTEESGTPVQP